jgi:hypothetical protein
LERGHLGRLGTERDWERDWSARILPAMSAQRENKDAIDSTLCERKTSVAGWRTLCGQDARAPASGKLS